MLPNCSDSRHLFNAEPKTYLQQDQIAVNILTKIYWIRVALGATAGLVCTGISYLGQAYLGTPAIQQIANTTTLLNGVTVALLVYLLSIYALKAKYGATIEKPSKITSMGIFIYFFTWIVVWVLTLSVLISSPV